MNKESKNKETLVLLDSHAILHRAYHALPDFSSQKGEPTGALYGLTTMVIKIIEELRPTYIVACYDLPQKTYRHEAYEAYKAGRSKTDDALVAQIKRSRDIFEALGIVMYDMPGFEADDMLGTIVEQAKDLDINIIIASGDMDTLQLVNGDKVCVYTLKKGIKDTILYNEKAVIDRFGFKPGYLIDYKGLRGDPSDNIPGIKGIGEKTATTLVGSFGTLENLYDVLEKDVDKVKKVGITDRIVTLLTEQKDEAFFSKMLATIRRDAPISFTLPDHPWKESLSLAKAQTLFEQLDFRTMTMRLRDSLLFLDGNERSVGEMDVPVAESVVLSDQEQKDFAVMVWLLDSSITNPTYEDIVRFAKAKEPRGIRAALEKSIHEHGLDDIYNNIERPLIKVIERMNKKGVLIDTDHLKRLSVKYHETLSVLEKTIWNHAGKEFNISSPKQLGQVLFDDLKISGSRKKTSTGARSTQESELEKLVDKHPIIASILEYRELSKLVSTYIDVLPTLLAGDGRLHAEFLQTGTTTGRMASRNPNLQNIPIKTDLGRVIRGAFVSAQGKVLVSLDYSQIELRIAAILSRDSLLCDVFKRGGDIHTAVASRVFNVSPDDVDGEMRRRAKVINFGILYGMGVLALKQNLNTTREEAQQFYLNYFKAYPELAKYIEQVKVDARTKGYTETLFGRRRYLPALKSKLPYLQAAAERMAINAPIQGTSADIIKRAMVDVDAYLQEHNLQDSVALILQIHDELVFEVDEGSVEIIVPMLKQKMESVVSPDLAHNVPIVAHAYVGSRWDEMKKIT